VLLTVCIVPTLAQCDINEFNSINAQLSTANAAVAGFKKAVIAIAIILPIIIILVVILLVIILRKLLKLKKILPPPIRNKSFIAFIRALDKGFDVEVGVGVDIAIEKKDDEEEKKKKIKLEEEEEERKKKKKLEEEEDAEKKKKKRIEEEEEAEKKKKKKKLEEDEEEEKKKKKKKVEEEEEEKKKKKDVKKKKKKVEEAIEMDELVIEDEVERRTFHCTHKGKFRDDLVVFKQIAYCSVETEEDVYAEFKEEHDRRKKIAKETKSNHLVEYKGIYAEHPYYGFISKWYTSGSVYAAFVQRKYKYSLKDVAKIALDVAEAVYSLHKIDIVHKGIAARNVLFESATSGKVSVALDLVFDPSWSKLVFGKQHSYVGPVAWMAPEALEHREFTNATDSFSFGVFLWELIAREDPYAKRNAIEVACPVVHRGLRLEIPADTPAELAALMKSCFGDAKERPSFEEIIKIVKEYHDSEN